MAHLPDYDEILTLASKPNALLLLAVDEREVSWTSFLAWLLDPRRSGRLAGCAARTLKTVLLDHPACVSPHPRVSEALRRLAAEELEPAWARAEVTRARSRFDLLAELHTPDGDVRVLIENKIRASESPGQMATYVEQAAKDTPPGTLLLPVFLTIGSQPPASTSCAWAVLLDRGHVSRWLNDLLIEASRVGASPPPLLHDYIDLLRLWTLADRTRRASWQEIERIQDAREKPADWPRVERWLNVGNDAFYGAVGSSPVLAQTFGRLGLGSCTFQSTLNQTTGFQFYRESWSIREPLLRPKGIEVHYESAKRGELFIHVEVSPYEGSIEANPSRLAELAHALAAKARVQTAIRARATALAERERWMGATLARLGDPARAGKLAAIKYTLGKEERAVTPEECATFFARLIAATVDIIDEEIAAERDRLGGLTPT